MADDDDDELPAEAPEVQGWIIKMFAALSLGTPTFATASKPATGSGDDPPEPPKGEAPKDGEDGIGPRRVAILLRLDKIVLHEHVPAEERATIGGHIANVRTVVAKSTTPDEIGKVETAVTRLETIAASANAAADLRGARCLQVATTMAGITRPVGGVEADYLAYDAELPAIRAIDTPPVAETTIAGAEAAVGRLQTEASRLADVLAGRRQKAKDLRASIPAKLPEGANPAETSAVRGAEEKALAALGPDGGALSPEALAQAEGHLKDRDTALDLAGKAVAVRAKAREVVTGVLTGLDLDGITEVEGLTGLTGEREAITTALPLALTDEAIEALAQRAAKLGPAAETARATRAKAILTALDLLKMPERLPDDEVAPLQSKADAIRTGATPPLTGGGLATAAGGLGPLSDLLKAAVETVKDRETRATAAKEAAALVTDPDKANTAEEAALDLLRKAPALSPAAPLTEAMVLSAEAALKALTEAKAAQILAITSREKARKAALDEVLKLVPPMNAPGTQALAMLKTAGALRKLLEEAETQGEIEAQDVAVKDLDKEIKALAAFTTARDQAAVKLAVAQGEVKKASYEINQGCYQAALALSKAAAQLLDQAKTVGDCTKAESKMGEIAPLILAAKNYQPAMEQWRFDTELYITGLKATTDTEKEIKRVIVAQREALLTAADLLAAAGDIPKALAKLDEFKTAKVAYKDPADNKDKQAAFDDTHDKAAKRFAGLVATFVSDCIPTVRRVERLKLTDPVGKFQSEFMAVKKKGFDDGNYGGAETDLGTLTTAVKRFTAVAEMFDRLLPVAGMPAVKTNYDEALDFAKKDDLTEAKKKLDAIPKASGEEAAFRTRVAGLTKRVENFTDQLSGALKARIETPWNAAPGEPDHAKKMAKLDEVELVLKDVGPFLRARDIAEGLCNRFDKAAAYGIMAQAKLKETGTFAEAKAAYETAAQDARRLSLYLDRVAALEATRKALKPEQAETDKLVGEALTKADTEAKARKWDEADSALGAATAEPVVQALSTEVAIYQAKLKKLTPLQTRLVKQITEPKPNAALVDPWTAAIAMAETKNDPVAATELLVAHEAVLKTAQTYAGAASQARLGLTAMEKIETRAVADVKAKAKAAAEAEVAKAKLAAEKAQEAFDKATEAVKQANEAVSKLKKTDDPTNAKAEQTKAKTALTKATKAKTEKDKAYNDLKSALPGKITANQTTAGDAVTNAIYPPGKTKVELNKLLADAEAEAGKGDFAKAETLFKLVCTAAKAGMVAAGDAIEEVENAHYVSAHGPTVTDGDSTKRLLTGLRPDGKMEPSSTSSSFGSVEAMLATREAALTELAVKFPKTNGTSLKDGEVLEYFVETDSEVPVGKSFKGNKMKKKYQAGEFKESDLCENFRELGPLTRVFTKVIFHFVHPGGGKPLTNWNAVKEAYGKTKPPTPLPTDFPGQWVVHQHYPTATGYDPETGTYTD